MRFDYLALLPAFAALAIGLPRQQARAQSRGAASEWYTNGRDDGLTRYSPLTQITPENVNTLVVAWTYHTGETNRQQYPVRRDPRFEATPLMVDGALYVSTPLGRAIALDPVSGRELWTFSAGIDLAANWGDFANRGVSTWLDPSLGANAACKRRIFLTTIDAQIVALDSRTGRPCAGFGDHGRINLRTGLYNPPFEKEEYQLTSPPAVIGDLLVTGSSVADNNRTNAASGEVRAFDVRTGALRWSWDPVPRDSSDRAWNTWRGAMGHTTGAANVWSIIAADPARDLVFVPTGSASPDYFGGERFGDNRYANSVVALRAATGKVVWDFQAVHHDLWDYDLAAPPTLAMVSHGGRTTPAVLQATKSGQLFVLDRETGKPILPVEERPVPRSGVAGERASPTQPFSVAIPALSPQSFTQADVWGPTDGDRANCLEQVKSLRNEGVFTPPSLEGSLVIPSNIGGTAWGGLAFDSARQIAVVPVNRIPAFVQLIPLDRLDTAEVRLNRSRLGDEYTRMHGTPFVMRRRLIVGPSRLPCSKPPFGSLLAIDLRTGSKIWEVPLGNLAALVPGVFKEKPAADIGSPVLGGPIITATGVVFIGGTIDHAFRAFDVRTGRKLWEASLSAGARATPMTYEVGGRQYVVIAVGGGEEFGAGDTVVAFALPTGRR